jgi:uncharacterized membrane protein
VIKLSAVYILFGLLFSGYAALSALDRTNPRRWGSAAFWGLVAVAFLFGDVIGDLGNGAVVLGLAAIAGFGRLGRGEPSTTAQARQASADRLGDRIFIPALLLPALLLIGLVWLKPVRIAGAPLIDPAQATLVCLALAALGAVAAAVVLLRQPLLAPLQEGRRLMDMVGWAALLPQALAALGAIFALAGVGQAVGGLLQGWLPTDARLAAVAVYAVGMAAFTMVMGNAFAAFPVMTAGVGVPVLIRHFGGDPAVVGAVGMLSGFCGTLMTPLAANFNLVPPALLELNDRYAVIKAQAPAALLLLLVNLGLLHVFAFR